MPYKKIKVPKKGSKITYENGKINIPNNPIIPYIEGDGIGVDITPPMINVVNEANNFLSRKVNLKIKQTLDKESLGIKEISLLPYIRGIIGRKSFEHGGRRN